MHLFFHRCQNFPLFEQLRKKGEIGIAYTIKTVDGRDRPLGTGEAVHCGVFSEGRVIWLSRRPFFER
jgi:hypothetical protein